MVIFKALIEQETWLSEKKNTGLLSNAKLTNCIMALCWPVHDYYLPYLVTADSLETHTTFSMYSNNK
jgi:hypothetical protein